MHGMSNVNNWIDVCITVLTASVFEDSCINWGWVSKERETYSTHREYDKIHTLLLLSVAKILWHWCGINKHELLME
jgi:hypothetical protein